MKLYTPPPPPYLIRVNIKKQGSQTEFITLCETTQEEALNYVKRIIEAQNLSPFTQGRVTNIEFREGEGRDNGKSISLSFKGLEPQEVHFLILREINGVDHIEPKETLVEIESLGLSVKAYNCCKVAKLNTIVDILRHSENDLYRLRNFGKRSVDEIKIILKEKGLSLKEN